MSTRRKAVIYTAVIFLMLLSIWAFGILGPIFVSLVLEGIAWWLKKREKKKEMLTKCLTLCENKVTMPVVIRVKRQVKANFLSL